MVKLPYTLSISSGVQCLLYNSYYRHARGHHHRVEQQMEGSQPAVHPSEIEFQSFHVQEQRLQVHTELIPEPPHPDVRRMTSHRTAKRDCKYHHQTQNALPRYPTEKCMDHLTLLIKSSLLSIRKAVC